MLPFTDCRVRVFIVALRFGGGGGGSGGGSGGGAVGDWLRVRWFVERRGFWMGVVVVMVMTKRWKRLFGRRLEAELYAEQFRLPL